MNNVQDERAFVAEDPRTRCVSQCVWCVDILSCASIHQSGEQLNRCLDKAVRT